MLVFQDRVGFTMKERLQLVSLPQMGSSDSLDSERRTERPSKGRCHKPIVNRIAYARMSHSSTEVAGYTVEYVGVSMKRNGHLVEMGMYFSVIEVAAGEPCMRVRVHRDGFGGPFWDDSGNFMVIEQDVHSQPSSLAGRSSRTFAGMSGERLPLPVEELRKKCPGCRLMAHLTEGLCVACREGLKVSYDDVMVRRSPTDPGVVCLTYSLLQDKKGPWSEQCRISEICRIITERKSYRRYKNAELPRPVAAKATRAGKFQPVRVPSYRGMPGSSSSAMAGSAACALGPAGFWGWCVPVTAANDELMPFYTTPGSAEEPVRPRIDQCPQGAQDRPRIKNDCLHGLKQLLGGEGPPTLEEPASLEQWHVRNGLEDQHRNRRIEVAKGGMESMVMHGPLTQQGQEPNDMCGYQEQGDAQRGIEREAHDEAMERDCVICLAAVPKFICIPCGHVCVCGNCRHFVNEKCPMCREDVERVLEVFFP